MPEKSRNKSESGSATGISRSIQHPESLQAIIDNLPGLLWIKDRDGRFTEANNAFSRAFSSENPQQVLGKTGYDLFQEDVALKLSEMERAAVSEMGKQSQTGYISVCGRNRLFQVLVSPLVAADGTVNGTTGYATDITDSKVDEETFVAFSDFMENKNKEVSAALEVAEEGTRFKSILLEAQSETTIDGILTVDNDGKVILFNSRFGEIWNIPRAILEQRDSHELLGYLLTQVKYPEGFTTRVNQLNRHRYEKGRDEIELADGRFFDRYSSPLIDADRVCLGRIWFFRDITVQKQSEKALQMKTLLLEEEINKRRKTQDELAEKQVQLEILNQSLQQRVDDSLAELRKKDQVLISQSRQAAMGEMIGNIAHQWRQPLNALSMLIGNLAFAQRHEELTDEFMDEATATANRLIQKMSSTINDFRNFFSPDKMKEPFSALQKVKYTVELIEAAYKNSYITITVEAETDCTLHGFPNEYSQVLMNLLANSRDAIIESGATSGRISMVITVEDGMGVVTVRDTGGGIPADILDKIFEPYFSTKKMGTGIGLYMSKMIIERNMSGRISARIIEGGTEFIVCTPLSETV